MTHAEKVLALLSDGKPHTHHEGYALGVILHSRVSDLRRAGHTIDHWRETVNGETVSVYRLRGLDETEASDGTDGVPRPAGPVSSSPSELAGPPSIATSLSPRAGALAGTGDVAPSTAGTGRPGGGPASSPRGDNGTLGPPERKPGAGLTHSTHPLSPPGDHGPDGPRLLDPAVRSVALVPDPYVHDDQEALW